MVAPSSGRSSYRTAKVSVGPFYRSPPDRNHSRSGEPASVSDRHRVAIVLQAKSQTFKEDKSMSGAHWHLILNHIPVVTLDLSLLMLVVAAVIKHRCHSRQFVTVGLLDF